MHRNLLAGLFAILLSSCGIQQLTANMAGHNVTFHRLPDHVIEVLRPHYDIDWSRLEYAVGQKTIHGMNMAVGNRIYFTKPELNLMKRSEFKLMLHELEHVRQYRVSGAEMGFTAKYTVQAVGQFLGSVVRLESPDKVFQPHKHMDLEREAQEKSENLVDKLHQKVKYQIWLAEYNASLNQEPEIETYNPEDHLLEESFND